MANNSQTTEYIALREFGSLTSPSSWNAQNPFSVDVANNRTLVCTQTDEPNQCFIRFTNSVGVVPSALNGTFISPADLWKTPDGNSWLMYYRGILKPTDIVSAGQAAEPDFYARGRGIIIRNENSGTIYVRRGTANEAGDVIAAPSQVAGDATLANVVGIPIIGGQYYMLGADEFQEGDPFYLLASAASQYATVQFL